MRLNVFGRHFAIALAGCCLSWAGMNAFADDAPKIHGRTGSVNNMGSKPSAPAAPAMRQSRSALLGKAAQQKGKHHAPAHVVRADWLVHGSGAPSPRTGQTCDINITGLNSMDLFGDSSNVVLMIDLADCIGLPSGTAVIVNGIGWNASVHPIGESWTTEANWVISNSTDPGSGLGIIPFVGDNSADEYSTQSVTKLATEGLSNILLSDGFLRVELCEDLTDGIFDDNPNAADATYIANPDSSQSIITIQAVNGGVAGSCCLQDGSCLPVDNAAECNGNYTPGESCDPNNCPQPIPGDHCFNAFPLAIPADSTGTTVGFTPETESLPICDDDYSGTPGVWFTVVGDGATLTATTCNSGTDFDTKLHVYCGSCTQLFCVTSNDDGGTADCNLPSGNPYKSRVSWCSASGQTYYILLSGFSGTGNYELMVTSDSTPCSTAPSCSPPANDNCIDAIAITEGTTPFSNSGASTDGPDEPGDCDFFGYTQIDSDIWYCYTAGCSGNVTISLCGSGFDTKMAVYDGCTCPPSGAPIACNEDFCGLQSQLEIPATAGNHYLIRIGGYFGAQGSGTITIACPTGSCCATQCPNECLNGFTADQCAELDANAGGTGGSAWAFQVNSVCGENEPCLGLEHAECCKGDVNNDNRKNGLDVAAFLAEMLGGSCFDGGGHPRVAYCAADMNYDFVINLNDVPAFVAALLSDGLCHPEFACPCGETPPGSVSEQEFCDDSGNGRTNDGCFSNYCTTHTCAPAPSSVYENIPLVCGGGPVSICGNLWALNNQADTDWYGPINLNQTRNLTVTIRSNTIPAEIFVQTVSDCDNPTGVAGLRIDSTGCTPGTATATVPPGQYAVIVVPGTVAGGQVFTGFPCAETNNYTLTIECSDAPMGACCSGASPTACTNNVLEADCVGFGATWHAGMTCAQVGNCPVLDCGAGTLTQNPSQAVTAATGIACGDGINTRLNAYARCFSSASVSTAVPGRVIKCIGIGIEGGSSVDVVAQLRFDSVPGGSCPLSATNGGFGLPGVAGTVQLGATLNVTIPANFPAGLLNVDIPDITLPAGRDLVVEFQIPDTLTTGGIWPGSNATADTSPHYLASAACGATNYTPLANLGVMGIHSWVVVLKGD